VVTGSPSPAMNCGGAAGRDQLDAGVVQAADEVGQTGLVVDRDQRSPDRSDVLEGPGALTAADMRDLLSCHPGHPGGRCSRNHSPVVAHLRQSSVGERVSHRVGAGEKRAATRGGC
jgi:hypothetical protein